MKNLQMIKCPSCDRECYIAENQNGEAEYIGENGGLHLKPVEGKLFMVRGDDVCVECYGKQKGEEQNMKREKLMSEIEELKKQREYFELEDGDYSESFDDLIDEEGDIVILGMRHCRSTVLQEVDPIAYRCCLRDYLSSLDVEDDPKYQALCEQIEELEYELERLKEESEKGE